MKNYQKTSTCMFISSIISTLLMITFAMEAYSGPCQDAISDYEEKASIANMLVNEYSSYYMTSLITGMPCWYERDRANSAIDDLEDASLKANKICGYTATIPMCNPYYAQILSMGKSPSVLKRMDKEVRAINTYFFKSEKKNNLDISYPDLLELLSLSVNENTMKLYRCARHYLGFDEAQRTP